MYSCLVVALVAWFLLGRNEYSSTVEFLYTKFLNVALVRNVLSLGRFLVQSCFSSCQDSIATGCVSIAFIGKLSQIPPGIWYRSLGLLHPKEVPVIKPFYTFNSI